ncbi:thioesterase II family protein [Amycolatopsis sp. lyj-23]|uniref:thioesterase II family protein n=1 Tax=Amycolatopsis sp. lyj-23 TaxID=2789283 RepID=UPI00397BB54D
MTTTTSPWFTTPGPGIRAAPALPLFCLPHAGAGPAVFRAWPAGLDERVEVVAVQYPGRAARIAEPAEESIRRLAERVAGPVAERTGTAPYALFGHSMGALAAFELARVLSGLGRPPRHLVVSGQTPPHHYRPTGVHALPDEEFREAVVALAGTEPGVLASPTLWEMLLPILRADFRACETYEYAAGALLTTDLTVVSGDDDPTVDTATLDRWAELTEGRTSVHVLPGGHFYLTERPAAVLDVIGAALGPLLLESP